MANNADGNILYLLDGWAEATLDDIAIWGSGGTPSRKQPNYFQGAIPWFKTGELGDKYIYDSEEKISQEAVDNSSAKIFPKGSVAIAMYGATVGKISILGVDAATNQACAVAQVDTSCISNEFLYYFLLSIRGELVKVGKGGAQPNISQGILKGWNILVPPTNEQYRIVAKIEEIFSELDKGAEYLKTVQEQLKVYRQSVLKAAFEGRLTEEWREAHANQLETADQLLERIHQERENCYQQQLNEWEEAVKTWEENGREVKKSNKPKQPENLSPLTEEELRELSNLPEGWIWLKLGNLNVEIFDGPFGSNLKTSDYIDEGIRVIRLENIGILQFNNENKMYISQEKYEALKRHTVIPGDVIFASFIVEETRVAIIPEYLEIAINKADCFCIRSQGNTIQNHYIAKFLSTRNAYHQLKSQVHGATRPRVNTTQLKNCAIPVASPFEQQQIHIKIEERFSMIGKLENDIEENLKRLELLRQSILRKTFSGQLVAQDPNDEPASILLERIRAERQAAPKPTRKPSTPKKKSRKKEVVDLISVLQSAKGWLSAQDAFRECGVSDGVETEVIEKLYLELRDLEKKDRIEVERRGDEDWLRIRSIGRS